MSESTEIIYSEDGSDIVSNSDNIAVVVIGEDPYTEWFGDFEEALLGNLETRTWPTAKQIGQAAKEIAPKRPEFRDDTQQKGYEPDELKINAKRIQNREDVGENYIFGTMANQMVRLGLVSEDQLQPYKEYLNNMKRG